MRFIANIIRLIYLALVLVCSGLLLRLILLYIAPNKLSRLRKNLGSHICRVAEFLGPSYIKLGQFLSTRPDLIGFEMSEQLTKLQDKLSAAPYRKVKKILNAQFKAPLDQIFQSFSEEAKAAASIAQVHQATLLSGEEVAIKILKPNVDRIIARDISLFKMLARIAQFMSRHARRMKLREVVHRLEEMLSAELDLRMEAAAADTIRDNLKDDKDVVIPKIYWKYCGKRVMVSEWCHGIPINDSKAIAQAGLNPEDIARKLSITFFNQAFRDGFFHADLHPGNIFVDMSGRIILVDFGITGSLDDRSRLFVADMLHGFLTRDYDKVARLHFEIGYISRKQSLPMFTLACRSIGEAVVGVPVNQISVAELMKQLFEVSERFDIKLQTQLILLQKTLVTIEGVGYSLYPDVNMWKLAEPWIVEWGRNNISKFAKLNRKTAEFRDIFVKLPDMLSKLEDIIGAWNKKIRKKNGFK